MNAQERYTKLQESVQEMGDKKIRFEERYKSEKERLEKLLAEITAKGYDPKKLPELREAKEKELLSMLNDLEALVKENALKLNAIEVAE